MLVKQKSKLTLEELPGELQTQKHGKSRQKCTQVFVFVFQFLRRILLCQCFHTVSKSIKQLMPNPWHFICGGGSKHLKYSRRRDTKTSKNGVITINVSLKRNSNDCLVFIWTNLTTGDQIESSWAPFNEC